MQCQLCAAFGDSLFKFDGLSMESLRKHSKLHGLQIGRISKNERKTRSWELNIFNRCFPNVTAGADAKGINVEKEIIGRRRRGSEIIHENNNDSKKKIRNRENLEETKKQTASANLESPAAPKCGVRSAEHAMKSCGCGHGLAALRSHCRELRSQFAQNGKMTCRQCSTSVVVANNIASAVDHVTRCHFGQQLYACRWCSKRYNAYYAMAQHANLVHHKSLADACIDQSGKYEDKIMELMTKCYGAAAKTKDKRKGGTVPTQPTRKWRTMMSGGCRCHGIVALRSHCNELTKNFSQNGKITCSQCSMALVVKGSIINAVDHVTRNHFGRSLYACRLCSKRSTSYGGMMQHGRVVHPHKSPMACFLDLSEQYEEEIMELMTQCYGAAAKEDDNTKNVAIANIPGKYVLTVAMRRCFHELKRKFGKFTCRICATHYARAEGIDVVSHITTIHFRKTLFTCRLCSKGFCSYLNLKSHLRKMHGLGMVGNYNGHIEQYEKEIIEWMVTCFGETEKTGQEERQSGVQNSD